MGRWDQGRDVVLFLPALSREDRRPDPRHLRQLEARFHAASQGGGEIIVTTLETVRPPTNDTEERLLDAALTLFAEKGYEAASVREIIEATGVTRPVLYYYCSSKEDLFKRLVHWKHDEAYRELTKTVTDTKGCANRLRAIMRGSFAFCATDPRVPRLMFQTHFGPTIPGIAEVSRFTGGCLSIWRGIGEASTCIAATIRSGLIDIT